MPLGDEFVGERCGAKTQVGTPCKNPAMPNGRCRMHGGRSPRGMGSATFKTGKYSTALPEDLLDQARAASEDRRLLDLRSEIALVTVLTEDLLTKLPEENTWDPVPGYEGFELQHEIFDLIERRRKLVQSEYRRLKQMKAMIPAEEALAFAAALVRSVKRNVSDREARQAIVDDLVEILRRQNIDLE